MALAACKGFRLYARAWLHLLAYLLRTYSPHLLGTYSQPTRNLLSYLTVRHYRDGLERQRWKSGGGRHHVLDASKNSKDGIFPLTFGKKCYIIRLDTTKTFVASSQNKWQED